MVNQFLIDGSMASGLNDANICLIPKTTKPNVMSQFRPISFWNVSYKIICKVLCQRLKKVLPGKISETQCTFVAGRQFQTILWLPMKCFMLLELNQADVIKGWPLRHIWVKHMIGWSGRSSKQSCKKWEFQKLGLFGYYDVSPWLHAWCLWMGNPWRILFQKKVYVKEIICPLSSLFYARKRSLAFLIM